MNKSQLIDKLSTRFEGNRKQAAHALDSVLDTITREIARGEKVAITGFGSFERAVRKGGKARNPQTGETIRTKKKNVPKFRPGQDLKNVVSGAKKLPKLVVAAPSAAAKKAAPAKKASASAARSAPAKKSSASTKKAAPAKKSTTKTAAAKKSPAKKSTTKSTAAKKSPAKKSTTKSTAAKSPAKKSTTKKTAAKKSTAKKSTAKKSPAKKSTAKRTAKRS